MLLEIVFIVMAAILQTRIHEICLYLVLTFAVYFWITNIITILGLVNIKSIRMTWRVMLNCRNQIKTGKSPDENSLLKKLDGGSIQGGIYPPKLKGDESI
jgi:hypothetical protein